MRVYFFFHPSCKRWFDIWFLSFRKTKSYRKEWCTFSYNNTDKRNVVIQLDDLDLTSTFGRDNLYRNETKRNCLFYIKSFLKIRMFKSWKMLCFVSLYFSMELTWKASTKNKIRFYYKISLSNDWACLKANMNFWDSFYFQSKSNRVHGIIRVSNYVLKS